VAINEKLSMLLQMSEANLLGESEQDESERFYSVRDIQPKGRPIPTTHVEEESQQSSSYQNMTEEEDPQLAAKWKAQRRAERRERNKDDPFYIANDDISSGQSTPFHDILKHSNGEDLDVDAIPIIDLNLGGGRSRDISPYISEAETRKKKKPKARKVEIAREETLDFGDTGSDEAKENSLHPGRPAAARGAKKSLLQVDSSSLGQFSIEGQGNGGDMPQHEIERREAEEAVMAKALAEVERLRLEMQRASERIEAAQGVPADGTLVKRKKKKKPVTGLPTTAESAGGEASTAADGGDAGEVVEKVKKKKKKKKKVKEPEPLPEEE